MLSRICSALRLPAMRSGLGSASESMTAAGVLTGRGLENFGEFGCGAPQKSRRSKRGAAGGYACLFNADIERSMSAFSGGYRAVQRAVTNRFRDVRRMHARAI